MLVSLECSRQENSTLTTRGHVLPRCLWVWSKSRFNCFGFCSYLYVGMQEQKQGDPDKILRQILKLSKVFITLYSSEYDLIKQNYFDLDF